MTAATRNHPYRYLADFYDSMLSSKTFTAIQEAARNAVLGPVLSRVHTACDLACGTGTTAVRLAKSGIQTIGVDNSPRMCRNTREKARRAKVSIRVLQADMRKFRLPGKVDLVLCEADSINHLDTKEELAQVAKCVAGALQPMGWFYFEVNNHLGFERYWKDIWWVEKPGRILVMRNGNDACHDRAWCDAEWFIRSARNTWQRRRERVEEVCWSEREIRRCLKNAGFNRVRARDASPFYNSPLITPGCRTFYLAQKAL